jgi:hypothetical protein
LKAPAVRFNHSAHSILDIELPPKGYHTSPIELPDLADTDPITLQEKPLVDWWQIERHAEKQGCSLEDAEEYFLDLGYELPESEPAPEPLAAEETMLIPRLTPSRDYSLKDEVARDLDRKLSDLETWMLLLSRYGSANLLISSINSDLAILNRPDRLDYVQEF